MSEDKPFSNDHRREEPKKVTAADGHVYHKSATANAAVAPTNKATLDNATKQGKMTSAELDFVTVVDYEFNLQGKLPDSSYFESEYNYTAKQLKSFLSSDLVQQALEERGITLNEGFVSHLPEEVREGLPFAKQTPKLSPIQLIVANKLLDLTDNKSEKKKLQDLGITTTKYQAWLRDPEFSGYMQKRAEALIGDVQHEAMLALLDRIRGGDLKAIQYYHEMTGRYVTKTAQGAGSQINYQILLVRLIEIIDEELDDNAAANRIAERIKSLVSAGQVAGMLDMPTPVIVQPEIAKPREITPGVQELMNKGMGYQT